MILNFDRPHKNAGRLDSLMAILEHVDEDATATVTLQNQKKHCKFSRKYKSTIILFDFKKLNFVEIYYRIKNFPFLIVTPTVTPGTIMSGLGHKAK